MTEQLSPDKRLSWDDLRRIADEVELKIHLAGMDARDRWRDLQPRLSEFQKLIAQKSHQASAAISEELAALGAALKRLREDIQPPQAPPP